MATMLSAEMEQAPNAALTLQADAMASMGLVASPPVGTRYKLKGEAEVTASADGQVTLSFDKLYLMHELEAEDLASRLYPGMTD